MHRDAARQARGARLELAGKVHTHWKRKAPSMKRHIPGMHDGEREIYIYCMDREPDMREHTNTARQARTARPKPVHMKKERLLVEPRFVHMRRPG